jgi:hypothetical protein
LAYTSPAPLAPVWDGLSAISLVLLVVIYVCHSRIGHRRAALSGFFLRRAPRFGTRVCATQSCSGRGDNPCAALQRLYHRDDRRAPAPPFAVWFPATVPIGHVDGQLCAYADEPRPPTPHPHQVNRVWRSFRAMRIVEGAADHAPSHCSSNTNRGDEQGGVTLLGSALSTVRWALLRSSRVVNREGIRLWRVGVRHGVICIPHTPTMPRPLCHRVDQRAGSPPGEGCVRRRPSGEGRRVCYGNDVRLDRTPAR